MPTYTYKRKDGSVFEIEQRITAPALSTCPSTGQAVSRVITGGAGLVFKGSGFYVTDYVRKGKEGSNGATSGSGGSGSDSGGSNSDGSGSSESASASAAEDGGKSSKKASEGEAKASSPSPKTDSPGKKEG